MPAPLIAQSPYIFPSLPRCTVLGSITFYAVRGSEAGYVWSLQTNQSGGSINPSTGVYTAGNKLHTVDTVKVTDSLGNIATREVRVTDGPTLAYLRNTCKERTDLVHSTHISDTEWNGYINSSAKELYDLVVSAYENDYNVAEPYQFMTDGQTQRYPLPPDFFKLLAVDVQTTNEQSGWVPVTRMNRGERARYMAPFQTYYGGTPGISASLRYKLEANNLWLLPTPTGGQWIQVLFVPLATEMKADTDVLYAVNGW